MAEPLRQDGLAASYNIADAGTKTVAASGTPEALVASSTPCAGVLVEYLASAALQGKANSGDVAVGQEDNEVHVLSAGGQRIFLPVRDAADIFVKVATNGDGVAYTIFGA